MDELKERLDKRSKEIEDSEFSSKPNGEAADGEHREADSKAATGSNIVYKEFDPKTFKFVEITKEERDRKEADMQIEIAKREEKKK